MSDEAHKDHGAKRGPVRAALARRSRRRLPSDLGQIRTIMAADRTLMAWVRTSLSMLSFGFTIYKFLDGLYAGKKLPTNDPAQIAGLFLAGMGTLAMVMGTAEYFDILRDMNQTERFNLRRPVLVMSILLSCSGVVLFFGIAGRLF